MPLSVRGARSGAVAPPTSQEVYALTPVVRHGVARDTEHVSGLTARLDRLPSDAPPRRGVC